MRLVVSRLALQIHHVPAEGLTEAGVDFDHLPAWRLYHADRVRAGLKHAGKLFFRGAQALLALHLFSDVEQGTGHAQRLVVRPAIEAGAALQVTRSAVFELYAVGQLVIAGRAFTQGAVGIAHVVALLVRHAFKKRIE